MPIKVKGVFADVLRACRQHYIYAGLFSALVNLLFLAPVLYMLQVYERVVPNEGGLTLLFGTVALVLALGCMALLDYARSRILVRASARLDRMLAQAVVDLSFAPNGGTRLKRQAIREFDTLRQTVSGSGIVALLDAPWTPIYVLVCLIIHPLIGLLALCGGGLLVFLAWRNDKATHEPITTANESAARAYAELETSVAAADTIRALGMREALVHRNMAARHSMMTLQTDASLSASRFVALSKFVRLLLQSLALGLGALLAIDHLISPGAIFAASFLVGRALAPIDQVLGAWKSLVQAKESYVTLSGLFEEYRAEPLRTKLPPPDGRLDVEGLTVLRPSQDSAILGNVRFTVSPGEAVGIIGPSGAGKSTLLRLIAGCAQPDRGCVRFGGAERDDWDPERLATFVGYMPQEPTLFAGTVKENIARFRSGLDASSDHWDSAAVEAAQLTGAHDIILHLPSGYDYNLSLGGRGLSAGQAQRISFARAVCGSPSYLLLDEPNSHLDSDGDLNLVAALNELKARGVTILVATHKFGILPILDTLIVLQDGQIRMQGPKDEVLKRIAPVEEAPLPASSPQIMRGRAG